MSIEAWLTVAGMLLTIAIGFVGLVLTIVGFFLKRELNRFDERLAILEQNDEHSARRIGRCEGALGMKPTTPIVKMTGETL